MLLRPAYLRLLLLSVLLGVPIAFACFFFVSIQHWLQHQVWQELPRTVGYDRAPWWWSLPALALAGLILAPIVTRMPGRGGHVPVRGLGGAPTAPRELPGVVLAAVLTLPLGVVLGPEAPLMAVGSALALLGIRLAKRAADPRSRGVVATAGSTAAISTILGGPLVAAVMVVEAAGLAGPELALLLLPCLTTSAAGALVFTGFGHWTGLSIGALSLPTVPPDAVPDAGDFLWGIPAAVLVALVVTHAHRLGEYTNQWTSQHAKAVRTILCAVAVGVCIAVYTLLTDRPPTEAALSGQAGLAQLAADPRSWPVGALIALVLCKGIAWGICLGCLRGGPIFPSLLVGTATAVACAGLPGFGDTPALALGIAVAATVVTGLPLTSSVLAGLLMGHDAYNQMPLIVISAVIAFLTSRLSQRRKREKTGSAAHGEA
ncbi:chloride channel core [Streptomyces pluripotens]|uniref:Chloride channel core n=2 Tax=Streptomyces TaxID=1883 RepID=A0A221P9U5_9ACTN|nr:MULTISPECIES: chloride channel protein [Streptomyces]ARP74577.1 chloride channel core [Streptomyces pluripotens]ASN28856.1 chloride channel core [Streptomyces pluripotens]KIE24400.1 chloride channel core [Streptomyces sp. MUSC 125]MCH0559442.1 chloride channel protein [Streptomyces sp. MUM 16J]